MDQPRGAVGAGLPGSAAGASGPAVHHEQTVGKTVSHWSWIPSSSSSMSIIVDIVILLIRRVLDATFSDLLEYFSQTNMCL